MLRSDPRRFLQRALERLRSHWNSGPSRLKLRRKLLAWSVPAALMLLAVIAKLITVLVVGDNAVDAFQRHDTDRLRKDLDTLSTFNVIEPQKVPFGRGALAVLEGRLDEAERQFSSVLSEDSSSCPVRINAELVRETQGDLAARAADKDRARDRYSSALEAVSGAGPGCFAGNQDSNEDRRHIREEAQPRLEAKIKSLEPAQSALPSPTTSNRPSGSPATSGQPSPSASGTTPTSSASTTAGASPSTSAPAGATTATGAAEPTAVGAPPTTAPSPPPAPLEPGGNGPNSVPIYGPGSGSTSGGSSGGGSGALNDVHPDRLPSVGDQPAPGHKLVTGNGKPFELLQQALADAAASGSNAENPVDN